MKKIGLLMMPLMAISLLASCGNNEILSYSLSNKRGDRMTYIAGLKDLLTIKKRAVSLKNGFTHRPRFFLLFEKL